MNRDHIYFDAGSRSNYEVRNNGTLNGNEFSGNRMNDVLVMRTRTEMFDMRVEGIMAAVTYEMQRQNIQMQPIFIANEDIYINYGQGGGGASGEAGNSLAAFSFVTGAVANRADKILVRNYHGYNQKSIVRTPKPLPNLRVSTAGLKTTANVMRGTGVLAGGAGLYLTYDQYASGQISGTEASIDAAFGVIGFFGPIGAAVSITYFGGKFLYEHFSEDTVFDKPRGY